MTRSTRSASQFAADLVTSGAFHGNRSVIASSLFTGNATIMEWILRGLIIPRRLLLCFSRIFAPDVVSGKVTYRVFSQ